MSSSDDPDDEVDRPTRVLILGGSSEATALATALAGRADVAVVLSLAGRTAAPAEQAVPTRSGGFGGADGLASYLRAKAVDVLVDATHPFAERISQNARAGAARAGVRLIAVGRPAWKPEPGDRWTEVATMAEAATALGSVPRRVFLTVGRLQLAAFAATPRHSYLVRTIDEVAPGHGLADATFLQARGPFVADEEARLMRDHRIDVLVTKNSGGAASAGKLDAARRLGLPVILVARPPSDGAALTVDGAVQAIVAHRTPRGV